jgi:hypothetical protein
MNFDSIDDIRQCGFEGFATIADLQASKCCEVPDVPGVYLVLRPNTAPLTFLDRSTGGHFKGIDPTAEVSVLKRKWAGVEHTLVYTLVEPGQAKRRPCGVA